MKKIISLFLSLLMIFGACSAAVSAAGDIGNADEAIEVNQSRSKVPVIRILGDAEPLYDENQNKIFHYRSFYVPEKEEGEEGDLLGSLANLLFPFLVDGLLTDNWAPLKTLSKKEKK